MFPDVCVGRLSDMSKVTELVSSRTRFNLEPIVFITTPEGFPAANTVPILQRHG